jgi:hypothetical protein
MFRSNLLGALFVVGCSGSAAAPASDAASTATAADAAPTETASASWRYGNVDDERAYCELYAKAEATRDCVVNEELRSARLRSCTSLTNCYRALLEPDAIERARTCLEEQADCRRQSGDCTSIAGESYGEKAEIRSSCASRVSACRAAGTKVELNCALPIASKHLDDFRECLSERTACGGIIDCLRRLGGPECS